MWSGEEQLKQALVGIKWFRRDPGPETFSETAAVLRIRGSSPSISRDVAVGEVGA